jgi:hypothetical protein
LTNATGGATYGTRNHTVVIVDNDSIGISVNDPKNSLNINMYPNPVLNNLIIESNESSINNISIMDALGKVIRFESNFSNPKNVLLVCNNLSSGIYYIQIKSEDRIFNKLFIKE